MRVPLTLITLLVTTLLVTGCGEDAPEPSSPEPTPEEASPRAPMAVDEPDACSACHAAIVDEWRASMHARAHHGADVIYGAMRRLRMGREGDELAGRCAQCHSPRDPEDPESAAARTGVSCATCHNLDGVDDADGTRRGARALTRAEGDTLRGPHDVSADADAPHDTGAAAPWLSDGRTICLACHGSMQNAQGAATCTTGAEYAEASDERTCTGCHMPVVDAPAGSASERPSHRSHGFLGPHELYVEEGSSDFLATAVALSPALDGRTLRATLENRTGHALPTGFPGRMILVRATGYDASGEAVWHNFTDAPMAQDPDAVLNKVYVDAEGEPTLPPYAARLARDTRLRPGESRELSWTLPANVVRAEIALLYRLLPPPAAQRLGIADAPEAGARPFLVVAVPGEGG